MNAVDPDAYGLDVLIGSGFCPLAAGVAGRIAEVVSVIMKLPLSTFGLLLMRKRSNDEIFVASVCKLIVTSKKPLEAVPEKLDGVAVSVFWANVATLTETTQMKESRIFFILVR